MIALAAAGEAEASAHSASAQHASPVRVIIVVDLGELLRKIGLSADKPPRGAVRRR